MDLEQKEAIELEVRRHLNKEESTYRSYLQSHFKQLTWGVGILFAAAGIVFTYLFGNTLDNLQTRVDKEVDSKMLAYSIDKKVRAELVEKIGAVIETQAKSPEVEKILATSIETISRRVVSDVADDELRVLIQ